MKEFIAPDLLNVISDVSEGVYAGSGAVNIPDEKDPTVLPNTPGGGGGSEYAPCWINWKCTWTGHNNGGHSVCHVSANHCGDHSGNCLVIDFVTNFTIKEVKNASGFTISSVGSNNFTLIRNNFFNPSESIGFNFEIVTSDMMYDESNNPLHGAIGTRNADAYYCKVVSYQCS